MWGGLSPTQLSRLALCTHFYIGISCVVDLEILRPESPSGQKISRMIYFSTSLLFTILLSIVRAQSNLEIIYQWKFLDIDLPLDFPSRGFIPENNIFTGIEVTEDRIFLSLPRLRSGVAATLVWAPRPSLYGPQPKSSPPLRAYPSWDWHAANTNCTGLTSVYRVRLDRCNRLWVLDSGLMDSLETYTPICPPKIVVFNLANDQPVRTILLPPEVLRPNTLMTNLIIDDSNSLGNCDSTLLYMSDTANPGIVVYDAGRDQSWRVTHPSMWPQPDQSTYEILGDRFTLLDGIVGMALSPPSPTGRLLYYQPLATDRIYSVLTSAIARPSTNDLEVTLVGRKSSQSACLATNPLDGSLIFNPVSETSIARWNPNTGVSDLIASDQELLQFVSEIAHMPRDNGHLWLLSSKFQKYFLQTWDPNSFNLRIMRVQGSALNYVPRTSPVIPLNVATAASNQLLHSIPSSLNFPQGPHYFFK